MQEFLTQISQAWASTSATEALAAALGLAYVVLAVRQHRLCWVAAFFSTLLYTAVFWRSGLTMQAGLQAFYVATAVWGWTAWRDGRQGDAPPVRRASWRLQLGGLALIALVTFATADVLARASGSSQPLLDAATTWASVFTTWMVVRKYLENWAWWFVIDSLIAVLCWRQGLYASALLYVAFLVLVVVGWLQWHRDWRRQSVSSAPR